LRAFGSLTQLGTRGFVIPINSDNKYTQMDVDRLTRLTDKQRICLRLVYAHMSSKEIALHLGIEPGTVDQYVKAAMRILGVGDRRAAAKLLAEYEGTSGTAPAGGGVAMREDQAGFSPTALRREPILPLPLEGLRPTYVGWSKRLTWIALIAIGIVIAFGALIGAAEGLTRLVWG
jgi:DNA-binding CsgD family transcriptional regulator